MTVSEADTATVRYRPLRESMCPPSHPYVFDSGYRCCTSFTGPACEPGMSSFTECCASGKTLECKEPPCHYYVYNDIEGIQSKLSSLHRCIHPVYDYYGVQYRGSTIQSRNFGTCVDWNRTPAMTDTEFDDDLRLTSTGACRNPDLDENGPWCYVMNELTGDLVKEPCNIAYCDKDTQENFEELLLQTEEVQPEEEESEDFLLRLSLPILTSQFTLGFHGAIDAIDGDFNTFALAHPGYSSWEAAISCVESEDFSVTRVVVYLHSAFHLDMYGVEPDPLGEEIMVALEIPDSTGTGTMGVVCTISLENYLDELNYLLNERKEFKCPSNSQATKVHLSQLFQQEKQMAIREVEVYGQLVPSRSDLPSPDKIINPSDYVVIEPPPEFMETVRNFEESLIYIDENSPSYILGIQEEGEDQEREDATMKPTLQELQDGLYKLRIEMDLKNKRIKKIHLTPNLVTQESSFMLRDGEI